MLRFCTEVNRATFAQTVTSRGLSGNSGFFFTIVSLRCWLKYLITIYVM